MKRKTIETINKTTIYLIGIVLYTLSTTSVYLMIEGEIILSVAMSIIFFLLYFYITKNKIICGEKK